MVIIPSTLKESIESILELRDEIVRAYTDPLGEDGIYSYTMKESAKAEPKERKERSLDPSNCHNCPLWENRTGSLFYFNPKKAQLLSVVQASEKSGSVLLPDAEEMYEKQMAAISISRSKRALVSLLKCPSNVFYREYADKCRAFLKEDMLSLSPSVMILFGMDLAHYILNNTRPYEEIRAKNKSFKVNGIRTYVTYSQRECIENPSYKRSVWEDLKVIGKALS